MNIQLAFGTTGLTLTQNQFNEFVTIINKIYHTYRFCMCRDTKNVVVPTLSSSTTILCTVNELANLRQLVTKGKNSIELAKLFVFNEN